MSETVHGLAEGGGDQAGAAPVGSGLVPRAWILRCGSLPAGGAPYGLGTTGTHGNGNSSYPWKTRR